VLRITARTVGGPAYLETIEELERELTNIIEDFTRAVDVEALCLAKKSGKRSLHRFGEGSFSVVSCRTKTSA